MKIQPIILLLIINFLLFSCEKNAVNITKTNQELQLQKVFFNGELQYEYTYTNAGKIYEEKSKFFYTKHLYDAQKRLIASDYYIDPGIYSSCYNRLEQAMQRKEWVNPKNTEKDTQRKFYYDDLGKLKKSTDRMGYSSYRLNENGRISRQTFYHNNKKSGFIDFKYDDKGNLHLKKHYHILENNKAELSTTTEYFFDNKRNPYQSLSALMIPGRNTNPNNIIKEIHTLHFEVDDSIEKVQATENSYKYNQAGYPVKKNRNIEFVYTKNGK